MFLHHLIHKISSNSSIFEINNTSNAINYGGINYIQTDILLYAVFLILIILGTIFGFFGTTNK